MKEEKKVTREHVLDGSFGEVLRAYRKQRHITQQQLAKQIGVHYNTISYWEQGTYLPDTRGLVLELARCLGLDQLETHHLLSASLFLFSAYWTVPVARNPLFTGREQELQNLSALLQQQDAIAVIQAFALSGLGGIGKTQLVIEYAYRHAEEYSATFWINAETRESILASLGEISYALNLPPYPEQQQLQHAIQHWLNTHRDWLLIVDNLEQPELLKPLLPAARQGKILYTTRLPALGMLAKTLEVTPLSYEESVQFLLLRASQATATSHRSVSEEDVCAANKLAVLLDGLPLALDQASAYIEQTKCSLDAFCEQFQRHPIRLLQERDKHLEHPISVVGTFVLAFEQLKQFHSAATELLIFCCFLASEEIPEALFTQNPTLLSPALQAEIDQPLGIHPLLKSLLSFALVQRHPRRQTLVVHRLVQAVLKAQFSLEEQYTWMTHLLCLLAQAFPKEVEDPEVWTWCEQLLPHVLYCLSQTEAGVSVPSELCLLLRHTAMYLFQRAQFTAAEPLFRRALALQTQVDGLNHPNLVVYLSDLSRLKMKLGQYDEAEGFYRSAISILEQSQPPDFLQHTALLNVVANGYLEQGHYREAEPLCLQVLSMREQNLEPDHPLIASSLNNLGLVYDIQSRYTEAEPLFQRAILMRKQAAGQDHFTLAPPLMNLARLYLHQGRYTESELTFQRTILICEKALGEQHPHVASCLSNLADLYAEQKRPGEAEALYLRARTILEQRLGPQHPLLTYTLHGLANLYVAMENYAEAEVLLLRALQIWQQSIPDHPETGNAFYGLASLFAGQKSYETAEQHCQQALALWRKAFGAEHVSIARALHLLGMIYLQQNQTKQAEQVLSQALSIRLARLGPEHQDTVATQQYLTWLQHGSSQA